jgi:hypothetical protein
VSVELGEFPAIAVNAASCTRSLLQLSKGNAEMNAAPTTTLSLCRIACMVAGCAISSAPVSDAAAQLDIHGPSGSAAFGTGVTVLSNGNIAVTDPSALANVGAVYLYKPSANLISTLTGRPARPHVRLTAHRPGPNLPVRNRIT